MFIAFLLFFGLVRLLQFQQVYDEWYDNKGIIQMDL